MYLKISNLQNSWSFSKQIGKHTLGIHHLANRENPLLHSFPPFSLFKLWFFFNEGRIKVNKIHPPTFLSGTHASTNYLFKKLGQGHKVSWIQIMTEKKRLYFTNETLIEKCKLLEKELWHLKSTITNRVTTNGYTIHLGAQIRLKGREKNKK